MFRRTPGAKRAAEKSGWWNFAAFGVILRTITFTFVW